MTNYNIRKIILNILTSYFVICPPKQNFGEISSALIETSPIGGPSGGYLFLM